jgi:hypothetical protein
LGVSSGPHVFRFCSHLPRSARGFALMRKLPPAGASIADCELVGGPANQL